MVDVAFQSATQAFLFLHARRTKIHNFICCLVSLPTGKGRETTPLVTTEIVPGRLNESEWSLLLDRDEGQDFAAEVVSEVVDAVLR